MSIEQPDIPAGFDWLGVTAAEIRAAALQSNRQAAPTDDVRVRIQQLERRIAGLEKTLDTLALELARVLTKGLSSLYGP